MTGTQHRRRRRSRGRATAHSSSTVPDNSNNNAGNDDDNTVDSLEVQILPEHEASGHTTHEFNRTVKVKRDYANRLMKLQEWLEDKYPQHFSRLFKKKLGYTPKAYRLSTMN